jgi:acyl-CoA thioesterase
MSESDPEQQLAERVVAAMMAADAFSRWMGIRVLAVARHEATIAMTVREDMVNGFGVSHGGIVFSLADSAFAFAANTHGRIAVSIENSITYPLPVRVGDELVAIAEEESASNRLGYYRVTVRRQDNAIVGLFRGTVYKTKTDYFSRGDAAEKEGEGEVK